VHWAAVVRCIVVRNAAAAAAAVPEVVVAGAEVWAHPVCVENRTARP